MTGFSAVDHTCLSYVLVPVKSQWQWSPARRKGSDFSFVFRAFGSPWSALTWWPCQGGWLKGHLGFASPSSGVPILNGPCCPRVTCCGFTSFLWCCLLSSEDLCKLPLYLRNAAQRGSQTIHFSGGWSVPGNLLFKSFVVFYWRVTEFVPVPPDIISL